jgi:two-component system KDP operon response regulator KdpE
VDWQGKSILVIDDESRMCELVAAVFSKHGAKVNCGHTGEEGLRLFYSNRPDLIILDYLMPNMNGLEVLQAIRRMSDLPVIMLTVVEDRDTMIRFLQTGADEYIAKPFNTEELLARAWAVLRRSIAASQNGDTADYDDGYLYFNLEAREVKVEGKPVKLTPTEFSLLSYLVGRTSFYCTFEQIINNVWGHNLDGSVDNVHVFVWQLRQKIEPDPKHPTYIISERSIGYRFIRQRQQ